MIGNPIDIPDFAQMPRPQEIEDRMVRFGLTSSVAAILGPSWDVFAKRLDVAFCTRRSAVGPILH